MYPIGQKNEKKTIDPPDIASVIDWTLFQYGPGAQCSSEAFTAELKAHGVKISMDKKDGVGRQCVYRTPVALRKV